jgi:uncharacterized protein (UPF0261 family)
MEVEGSKTVLLVGTLDTKGAEYAYLRDRLRNHELMTDVGTHRFHDDSPSVADGTPDAKS